MGGHAMLSRNCRFGEVVLRLLLVWVGGRQQDQDLPGVAAGLRVRPHTASRAARLSVPDIAQHGAADDEPLGVARKCQLDKQSHCLWPRVFSWNSNYGR
jgi:hypothetical protein